MSDEKTYWHFVNEKRCMSFTGEPIEVGKTYRIEGSPHLCERGLHASERAIDALAYAPGPVACIVTLGGTIIYGADKVVAQERTVLAMADVSEALHRFSYWCAEQAISAVGKIDPVFTAAMEAKRLWMLGELPAWELEKARLEAVRKLYSLDLGLTRPKDVLVARIISYIPGQKAGFGLENSIAMWAAHAITFDVANYFSFQALNEKIREEQNEKLEEMLYAAIGIETAR